MESQYKFAVGDILYRIFGDDYFIFGGTSLIPDDEIKVTRYVVRAFRVRDVIDFWWPNQYRLCAINQTDVRIIDKRWILFDSEVDACFNPALENVLNGWVEKTSVQPGQVRFNDCFFDDYRTAVSIADALTERELKVLAEFNARHNTTCEPDFTAVHDEKVKD